MFKTDVLGRGSTLVKISERLALARSDRMVGRGAELTEFQKTVTAAELPFNVLHVSGPGGVGKTTLLRAFTAFCDSVALPCALLDARDIEPSPDAFLQALGRSLNVPEAQAVLPFLAKEASRRVLLIDTYESLEMLDAWVRDAFLPQLSEETLIVLSGRIPPSSHWLADDAWQAMLHTVSLRNFSPDESREYLARRGVPEGRQRAAVEFTHGFPLALSLLADVFAQHTTISDNLVSLLDAVPNVVQALLERFVRDLPSSLHRSALEASALLRLTDEPILAHMLGLQEKAAQVRDIFQWMRGLSFMEPGVYGLFPHDIAREALLADLRWRDRDRYVELHQRARVFYAERLPIAEGRDQQRLLYDCIFLHHDNPVVRTAFTWNDTISAFPDTFHDSDREALLAMVARHEGEEAARIAGGWLARQPEAALVFRERGSLPGGQGSRIVGFLMLLTLEGTAKRQLVPDGVPDPAIALASQYLEQSGAALRPGEAARYLRFWMTADTYQSSSPVLSLLIVHAFRHFLTRSRVAFTFVACRDADLWGPVLDYLDIERLPTAGFTLEEGTRFGVYGHDWRVRPAAAWLDRLARKQTEGGGSLTLLPSEEDPLLVLSEPDFEKAVLEALRVFTNPEALRRNPLLRSRLVASRLVGSTAAIAAAKPEQKVSALQAAIREAAESLQAALRTARGYRALYHTYLEPAPTQDKAAELLDLPFNTYRRHLHAGIADVTRLLWLQEIGAAENE